MINSTLHNTATTPTNPMTPAAAAAKGTFVAAANPPLELEVGLGAPPPPALDEPPAVAAPPLVIALPSSAIVPSPPITEVDPLTTVAAKLVVKVSPILVIVSTTVAFVPLLPPTARNVLVGLLVARLASLLSILSVFSTALNRDWYCSGTAEMKGGGVTAAAERTEETMELMLPVMEAEAAADSMAMARLGRMEEGKYWDTRRAAAEERASGEVLVEGKGF
ncbi:MAG: hypothetical protein L6R39_006882 [Caloplaca ligustica]|nr:MAG: hypothetical protein L6R39_006882 [Caloplaca ligustica]